MKTIYALVLVFVSINLQAQKESHIFFGNEHQAGTNLHQRIVAHSERDIEINAAIEREILAVSEQSSAIVDSDVKNALAFDLAHAHFFYREMLNVNSLIEVTKVLTETYPDKALHTILLGVVLYPDFVQEVYDGAAIAGIMSAEDALIAVIQSGADSSLVSETNTKREALTIPANIPPLGLGSGDAGTAENEKTISAN